MTVQRNNQVWEQFYCPSNADRIRKRFPSETLIRFVHHHMDGRPGQKALEIGFSTGSDLLFLASRGYDVAGVEISGSAIATARGRFAEADLPAELVPWQQPLPFADERFDLVYALETLHYLGDRESFRQALNDMARLLTPGGAVLFSVPTRRHLFLTCCRELSEGRYEFTDARPDRSGAVIYIPDADMLKEDLSGLYEARVGYYEFCSDAARPEGLSSFHLVSGRVRK